MKIKLYYFYDASRHVSDEKRIEVSTIDWRGVYIGDRVFIQEIEIDAPDCAKPTDSALAKGLTESLNVEKQNILVEAHKKVSVIDDKIRQLAALTYTPESEE